MKVTIEIASVSGAVTKRDIQKNIDAQQRAVDRNGLAGDFVVLMDTMSILEGIKDELPTPNRSNDGTD